MAVKIRLKRTGRRNRPFYRICVFDGRTRRDGAPVEELGAYDPRATSWAEKVTLNRPRAHYWLTVGAQPSETVNSILKRFGVRKDGPVPTDEDEVQIKESADKPKAKPAPAPEPAAEAADEGAATATATAEPEEGAASETTDEPAAEAGAEEASGDEESGDKA